MTGDPTIDTLIEWLHSGAAITTGGATALGLIVRFAVVPLIDYLLSRYHISVTSQVKITVVYVASFLVTLVGDLITRQHLPLNQIAMISLLSGHVAIGLHQTQKQLLPAAAPAQASPSDVFKNHTSPPEA